MILFNCQGRTFTADELYEIMIKVCGGTITSAFFELEQKPIDELIYLIELTAKISKDSKPKDDVIPDDVEYE